MTPAREAEVRKEFEATKLFSDMVSYPGDAAMENGTYRWSRLEAAFKGYLSAHTDSQMSRDAELADWLLNHLWEIKQKFDKGGAPMSLRLHCSTSIVSVGPTYKKVVRDFVAAAIKEQTT